MGTGAGRALACPARQRLFDRDVIAPYRARLDTIPRRMNSGSSIVLIGFRGAGKTTVGRLLADRLSWDFVDADDVVESSAGCSIKEIFRRGGEAEFRQREHEALLHLAGEVGRSRVVAVGGGAVLWAENRAILARMGECVWLKAAADVLHGRIHDDPTTATRRPGLVSGGDLREVEELLSRRKPHYREVAKVEIETDGIAPLDVVERIVAALRVRPEPGRRT